MILRSEVDNALDFFGIVVQLDPDVHVSSGLSFDYHEHVFVSLLNPVSKLSQLWNDIVMRVLYQRLNVGLTRYHVLELRVQVVAFAFLLHFLRRFAFAEDL